MRRVPVDARPAVGGGNLRAAAADGIGPAHEGVFQEEVLGLLRLDHGSAGRQRDDAIHQADARVAAFRGQVDGRVAGRLEPAADQQRRHLRAALGVADRGLGLPAEHAGIQQGKAAVRFDHDSVLPADDLDVVRPAALAGQQFKPA